MPSINQAQKQVTDLVTNLSLKQQIMLGGATVVTVAVLALFVHMIGTPDYKPLMSGMEAADAQSLGAQLAAKNIPYEISPDGKTVSVPSDKLDSSRMAVASDGMPRSGRLGFELFDKMNWGQTEFDEKVNYQRALEAELERSIQTLRDVDSVRVHLVMPTDSIFLDRERKAKASVILKLRSGSMSNETRDGIARLVAGGVDKLSPDDVTVVDADTNRPLGASHDALSLGNNLNQELSTQLVQTLEPVVGPDHVRARVNVEIDPSTTEENDETYDPKSAVAVSAQRSEEQIGGGTLAGGVPGTSSNVPGGNAPPKTVTVSSDGTQVSKTESNTYAVNKVVRHTLQPGGRIRRITAALLVDDAIEVKQADGKRQENRRKRTPEELKQIEDLAKAAIGIDAARGDTLSVQDIAFDQPAAETPAKPTAMQKVRVTLNDWSSFIRYGALLLLFMLAYMLLLRPIKKQVLTTFRELPASVSTRKVSVAGVELAAGQDPSSLPPAQQRSLALKKQLVEKVNSEPAAASKLIQAWIHEEAK
jgi:flagellar M-ring protein FliF